LAYNRWAVGDLNWSITLFPPQTVAQDAEILLGDYEDFVYGAGKLDIKARHSPERLGGSP